jgi:hypothetical protein
VAELDARVVAFDVNETLFSLESLGPVFAAAALDPAAARPASPPGNSSGHLGFRCAADEPRGAG